MLQKNHQYLNFIPYIYQYSALLQNCQILVLTKGVIHLRRPHSGDPVISDFSDGEGGWPKMDVQLHLFLKTKFFLFVLFREQATAFKYF